MNGIEREIDKLGRIVLPKGYRQKLGMSENSKVSISIREDTICITSVETKCLMCASKKEVNTSLGICEKCIRRVKEEG